MSDFLPNDLLSSDSSDEYEARRLLDEIAEELAEKTNQRLIGEVHTRYPQSQAVEHQFYVVVPTPRYSYLLFSATHGIDEYPVTIRGPGQGEHRSCDDSGALKQALRDTFSAAPTRRIINQLIHSAS